MRNYFLLCLPGTGTSSPPQALIDSRNYGVYISGSGTIKIPAIDWAPVSVPGLRGDILLNPSLGNEEISYQAFIAPVNGTCGNYADYMTAYSAFRNDLTQVFGLYGYLDLVDSYFPDICRKVYMRGPIGFESESSLKSGTFDLTFSAKPQRWLKTQTITATYNSEKSLEWADYNSPIYGNSVVRITPIIKASAGGTFRFRSGALSDIMTVTVAADAPTFPVTIDSQRKECYIGLPLNSQNANQYVSFSKYKFPEFHTFDSNALNVSVIVDTSGMTLTIDPGWWLY